MGTAGGILLFLGSLVYLYAIFAWYGGALNGWLAAASFFGPFVAAFAIVSTITLFFMGIGMAAGKPMSTSKAMWMWKYIVGAGIAMLIVTESNGMLGLGVIGFLLTYIGAMTGRM